MFNGYASTLAFSWLDYWLSTSWMVWFLWHICIGLVLSCPHIFLRIRCQNLLSYMILKLRSCRFLKLICPSVSSLSHCCVITTKWLVICCGYLVIIWCCAAVSLLNVVACPLRNISNPSLVLRLAPCYRQRSVICPCYDFFFFLSDLLC